MRILKQIMIISFLVLGSSSAFANACCGTPTCPNRCNNDVCCGQMGGINYCDSSAGRLVCNNGFYSSCYCTRHAIMDLQRIQGCCLWQGGVLSVAPTGVVICNDGGVSEICTIQTISEGSDW